MALAWFGKKVALVDMDLGCSNDHVLLGIRSSQKGLADFIRNQSLPLDSLSMETGIEGLSFISGAGDTPGMANISHQAKGRLIKALKALPVDLVVLDLGPGTNYNIIDFFRVADTGVLVSGPEVTSITNSFSFLKSTSSS